MRKSVIAALAAIGLMAGCGESASPNTSVSVIQAGDASLDGTVYGLVNGPDSVLVPVPGTVVTLYLLAALDQPDTSQPPPPSDTLLWSGTLLDSVVPPPPPPPPPTDTVPPPPPDTTIPPPPPYCGADPTRSVQAVTDAAGRFRIAGVVVGIYTATLDPPATSGFGSTMVCYIYVGTDTHLDLYLPQAH